ncbi:MAG: transporter substrate-binding domain-containing protein [Lachnospiraceae bacterium]|nr:transporter substrate-binding domain-containing protein [Lachnospiraceae bacterium]
MKKKIISLLLCLSMTAALFSGCGVQKDTPESTNTDAEDAEEAAEEDGEESVETEVKPRFVVGFDAGFAPYGYQDGSGEYVGFDLSVAQAVCDYLGWELVKKPIVWEERDQELESEAIDCIWNGFSMNGREELYEFTDPYIDNSQVFVVTAESEITDWKDLKGKEVLVQAGSSALQALSTEESEDEEFADTMKKLKKSFGELTEVSDYSSAFDMLESGEADAIAMDISAAQYQMDQREEGTFIILEEAIVAEQYAVGFKLGNTQMRDLVQAVLYELLDDGTIKALAKDAEGRWDVSEIICLGK